MKRIATILAGLAITVGLVAPAHAESRIETSTVVKLMPRHVMHDGDPLRVCFMAQTEAALQEKVKMQVESKLLDSSDGWRVLVEYKAKPNTVHCMIGVVHGSGITLVRVRSLNGPGHLASTSRWVRFEVR